MMQTQLLASPWLLHCDSFSFSMYTSPSFIFLRLPLPLCLACDPFVFFLRCRKSPFLASLSLSRSVRPIPRIIPGCGVECGRPSFASSSVQPMSPASVILRRSFACAPQGSVKLTWNTRPRRPPHSLLSLSPSLSFSLSLSLSASDSLNSLTRLAPTACHTARVCPHRLCKSYIRAYKRMHSGRVTESRCIETVIGILGAGFSGLLTMKLRRFVEVERFY